MGDTCTVCGHSYELGVHVYCLWPLQCTLYTLFIIVMFLFYYYILKLYLPPPESLHDCLSLEAEILCPLGFTSHCVEQPGGEESPCTNASHWRKNNNNIVSTTTYTPFIIVMFLFYYCILKLYLPPPLNPGGTQLQEEPF